MLLYQRQQRIRRVKPSVRPEPGTYLGNAYAANNMFQITLHDRVGELQEHLLHPGFREQDGNVWARYNKRKTDVRDTSGQNEMHQDYDAVQLGVDFYKHVADRGDHQRVSVLGAMFGYGDAKTRTRGSRYVSRGQISGHSIGLYGTIYDQAKDEIGYYLDAWITGNNFKSSVSGQDIAETNYNLSGVVVSVELGLDTPLRIRPGAEYNSWVTYQLQVTYQGVDSGNLVETNGTKIGDNAHNVQTRLGARFYRKNVESYNGSTRPVNQPYAELNWYYNFNDYEMSFDGESLAIDGAKNIFELKVGYEKQVGNSVQLWGNVFGGWGSNGYKSYGFTAGATYSF